MAAKNQAFKKATTQQASAGATASSSRRVKGASKTSASKKKSSKKKATSASRKAEGTAVDAGPAQRGSLRKSTAKKSTAKKSTAKKSTAKKSTAKKSTARLSSPIQAAAMSRELSKQTPNKVATPAPSRRKAAKSTSSISGLASKSSKAVAQSADPQVSTPGLVTAPTVRKRRPPAAAPGQLSLGLSQGNESTSLEVHDMSGGEPLTSQLSGSEAAMTLPAFHLLDQDGDTVTRDTLLGSPLVLYFYPKDDTPGCTKEACGFRDELAAFREAGVRVVGVSPDKPGSHSRFSEKYSLGFTLLADVDKTLAQAFGVWKMKKNYGREYLGIERSTFVIDATGSVVRQWRGVRVAGHVPEVLQAVRDLG